VRFISITTAKRQAVVHRKETLMTPVKSILVVDDEFLLRYTLSLILERAGYQVKTATNGCDALKSIKLEKFNLVILDIKMPETDGITLLSQIHQLYPQTPVIMLTAYPSPDTMREAKAKGARDYLVKPIGPERLLAMVRKIFEESK
jgi:CheY-like chemotaxis protein